jgi:hypothetical protein
MEPLPLVPMINLFQPESKFIWGAEQGFSVSPDFAGGSTKVLRLKLAHANRAHLPQGSLMDTGLRR